MIPIESQMVAGYWPEGYYHGIPFTPKPSTPQPKRDSYVLGPRVHLWLGVDESRQLCKDKVELQGVMQSILGGSRSYRVFRKPIRGGSRSLFKTFVRSAEVICFAASLG